MVEVGNLLNLGLIKILLAEIYSKRNLTHDESCVVFDSAETLYSSISMFAFLTSEKTIVDNYEKIWKNITNSGKYE